MTSLQEQTDARLASGLGWFSIGLGLGEILAPGSMARLIGAPEGERSRAVLRSYGVREIAAGIGILSQPQTAGWMWSRVAGDIMDLATLGSALASRNANRGRLVAATAAVLGVTAVDILCSQQMTNPAAGTSRARQTSRIAKAITIDRSPEELYQFWRDLTNPPKFMQGLASVELLGANRSHWRMELPNGKSVEWDSQIMEDLTNRRIAWMASGTTGTDHTGSVTFEPLPGGRGTCVRMELCKPETGIANSVLFKLSAPIVEVKLENDLRRWKQLMETGEIMMSDASIHTGMHPAQPAPGFPQLVSA